MESEQRSCRRRAGRNRRSPCTGCTTHTPSPRPHHRTRHPRRTRNRSHKCRCPEGPATGAVWGAGGDPPTLSGAVVGAGTACRPRSSPVAWGRNRRNLRTASTSNTRSPARRRRSRRPTQRGTCSGTRLTPGGPAAAERAWERVGDARSRSGPAARNRHSPCTVCTTHTPSPRPHRRTRHRTRRRNRSHRCRCRVLRGVTRWGARHSRVVARTGGYDVCRDMAGSFKTTDSRRVKKRRESECERRGAKGVRTVGWRGWVRGVSRCAYGQVVAAAVRAMVDARQSSTAEGGRAVEALRSSRSQVPAQPPLAKGTAEQRTGKAVDPSKEGSY